MKRLLVILHVYYHDHVSYFIDKMKNINGCEWDLIVTYSEQSQRTKNKLENFKPDTKFVMVDNTGYDVWPFIQTIKAVDLSGYDYILKLHTKNINNPSIRLNGLKQTGHRWRNLLVDSMLKSPKQFSKCLKRLENNPKIGMISCYELFVNLTDRRPEDTYMLEKEATRIGLKIKTGKFCAGTMFMTRSSCLETIRMAELDHSVWGEEAKSHSKATLAHVYERIFGSVISESGMKIKGVSPHRLNSARTRIHKSLSPVFKSIITIDRHAIDGKKRLTILGKKFRLK
jgi:lipopolysaccharide biosynthesis protein